MTQQRPAEPLTAGAAGIPIPSARSPGDLPLPSPRARWAYTDWEQVLAILGEDRAACLSCAASETDAALLAFHQYLYGCERVPASIETLHDPKNGELWIWRGGEGLANLIQRTQAADAATKTEGEPAGDGCCRA